MLALLFLVACLGSVAAHLDPLLPKEWVRYHVTADSAASASTGGYMTYSEYATSCTEASSVFTKAIAFGACTVGYDANGQGSAVLYKFERVEGATLFYDYSFYPSPSCSGSPSSVFNNGSRPLGCGSESYNFAYGYTAPSVAVPWQGFNQGVVLQNWYTSRCTGLPQSWEAIALNYCYPVTKGSYPMAVADSQAVVFTSCESYGSSLTKEYVYNNCLNTYYQINFYFPKCKYVDEVNAYQTVICNQQL